MSLGELLVPHQAIRTMFLKQQQLLKPPATMVAERRTLEEDRPLNSGTEVFFQRNSNPVWKRTLCPYSHPLDFFVFNEWVSDSWVPHMQRGVTQTLVHTI